MSRTTHPLYHSETMAHMGLAASRPSENVPDLLGERERASGVPFPAAVREWYALQAGLEKPELYFAGELVPLEDLGDPYLYWSNDWPRHPLGLAGEGRLPVMVEDQGCCLWAVDLDGSEDPPVSAAHYGSPGPVSEVPWAPHAGSFSAFILAACWVNAWIYRTGFHMLLMQQRREDQPLSTADLASLRDRFAEGPRTLNRPRGSMTTRLTGRGVAFEVNDLPEDSATDGDAFPRACDFDIFERAGGPVRFRRWYIKSESHEALVRLAEDLRGWGLLKRLSWFSSSHDLELGRILGPILFRPAR